MLEKMKYPVTAACIGMLSSLPIFEMSAQDDNQRDIIFAQALNDYGLTDYAEEYITGVLKNKPANVHGLNAQLAEIYILQNDKDKMAKALDIIAKLPAGSRSQMSAKGSLGIYSFLKKDYDKAVSELEPVFEFVIAEMGKAALENRQNVLDLYRRPVNCLILAYQEKGQANKATDALKRIQSTIDPEMDPRAEIVTDASFLIGGIDKMRTRETVITTIVENAIKDVNEANKAKLTPLLVQKKTDDTKLAEALKSGNENLVKTARTAALKTYQQIGKLIGISDAEMEEYMNAEVFKLGRSVRLALFKRRGTLAGAEKKAFEAFNKSDWQDALFWIVDKCESLHWGKQDSLAAMGVVLSGRAYYELGDYLAGADTIKKYDALFKALDDAFKASGNIEDSPGADARFWEGMCSIAAAQEAEKKNNQPEILKNYIRAFVNFGRVGKNYPKYKDVYKAYQNFMTASAKVAELNPKMAERVAAEMKSFPEPQYKGAANVEIEKLCSPAVEQNFNSKKYAEVIAALYPIIPEKRNSTGMPEVLYRLLVSYASTGATFEALAIADYMTGKYPLDQYTKVGLIQAGNAAWDEARKMEADGKSNIQDVLAKKDQAIEFYVLYLRADKSDKNAALIATKIAREFLNRAIRTGEELNAIPATQNDRRVLKKAEWVDAYDKVIETYDFIIKNFTNNPERMVEAYQTVSMAYSVTDRHADAAKTLREFIAFGAPQDAAAILNAKYSLGERLYSEAGNIRARAENDLNINLAALPVPEKPIAPVPPVKPAEVEKESDEAVAAPAEAVETPAEAVEVPAAEGDNASEKKDDAAKVDPMAAYELAMKEFEAAEVEYKKALAEYEESMKVYESKVAELRKAAADAPLANFKEAISILAALRRDWSADKVRALPAEQKADASKMLLRSDVEGVLAKVDALMPWLYDGAGMKNDAIRELENFIAKSNDVKRKPSYQMRLGLIWLDFAQEAEKAGKQSEAAEANKKAEDALAKVRQLYPESPEAKNSDYYLAMALIGRKNYDRALVKISEMLGDTKLSANLSVGNLRTLLNRLKNSDVSGDAAKDAAKVRLMIAERLIAALRAPAVDDWLSGERAVEVRNNPERWTAIAKTLEESLNYDAGLAALQAGEFKKAVDFFDTMTRINDNSFYYNELRFARAEAKAGLGDFEGARKDYGEIVARAGQYKNYPLMYRAQSLAGDTYFNEKNYEMAFSMYGMIGMAAFNDESWTILPGTPYSEFVEHAIYRAAYTSALLGDTFKEDKDIMVEKYRKNYPRGKYLMDIGNLPASIAK